MWELARLSNANGSQVLFIHVMRKHDSMRVAENFYLHLQVYTDQQWSRRLSDIRAEDLPAQRETSECFP